MLLIAKPQNPRVLAAVDVLQRPSSPVTPTNSVYMWLLSIQFVLYVECGSMYVEYKLFLCWPWIIPCLVYRFSFMLSVNQCMLSISCFYVEYRSLYFEYQTILWHYIVTLHFVTIKTVFMLTVDQYMLSIKLCLCWVWIIPYWD